MITSSKSPKNLKKLARKEKNKLSKHNQKESDANWQEKATKEVNEAKMIPKSEIDAFLNVWKVLSDQERLLKFKELGLNGNRVFTIALYPFIVGDLVAISDKMKAERNNS